MIDDGISVTVDLSNVVKNLEAKNRKAQKVLDAQVLKDSNYYCPMYTGMLQKSGILHTVLGSGRVIWQTPYAHEQYYMHPNKSHQHNPNATMRWFETAKAVKQKQWEQLVNAVYSEGN